LVPNQLGYAPGQRGSIELWEKVLTPAGIELDYAPFETDELRKVLYAPGNNTKKAFEMVRGYFNRFQLLRDLDKFDAVFVYREAALIGPAILERLVARKKPVIYQLDDPLFIPYRSQYNGHFAKLKFVGKIKEIISLSKVVMVNSSHIEDYARQFNKNIWRVPSVVDTDKYIYNAQDQDVDRPIVGWSGSPTTAQNLRLIQEPLKVLSERKNCDIRFIGSSDPGLDGVSYSTQKWNGSTEVDDLRRLQIGLVPLADLVWNPYKFIMKTAQYMALGIVPVGTPIASNPEVIQHGENGFLAESNEDWVRYIQLLIDDKELRMKLSSQAAKDAEANYSLRSQTSKVVEAFRAAIR